MDNQKLFTTDRLLLKPLSVNDSEFVIELVNTKEWIAFIGERNVKSHSDAKAFIQKNIDDEKVSIWTIRLKSNNVSIGIITFIKRDHLEFHDIGFALLPGYTGNGYAFEAADAVLKAKLKQKEHRHILATTDTDNFRSIRLLEKLGLTFERVIENEGRKVNVYII